MTLLNFKSPYIHHQFFRSPRSIPRLKGACVKDDLLARQVINEKTHRIVVVGNLLLDLIKLELELK